MPGNGKTQDGIWLVPDLAGLRMLPCSELDDGTPCWVVAAASRFSLLKNDGRADDGVNILAPLAGAPSAGAANARWLRDASMPVPGAGDVGALLAVTAPGQIGFTFGPNPFYSLIAYEEILGAFSSAWTQMTAGGGTNSFTTTTVTSQTHQGIVTFLTGSVGGGAGFRTQLTSYLLPDDFLFQYLLNVSILSAPAQRYKIKLGYLNQSSAIATDPTIGLWVEYDEATSPNWLLREASVLAGGGAMTVDTLIPVTVGWHLVELRRSAGGAAQVVIDGVPSVSAPLANIPRPTEFLNGYIAAIKTVGNTSVNVYFDYLKAAMMFPSGRTLG